MPYRFAKEAVEVRLTGRTVEVFANGERIAAHLRSSGNGKHTFPLLRTPLGEQTLAQLAK